VILMSKRTLDYLFIFVVTESNFKKFPIVLTSVGNIFGCQILVARWSGFDSCVKYLSRLYLIKIG